MFKRKRGIRLPYNKQGLIYFTCINFSNQPDKVKNKIMRLCDEIGQEYSSALFEVLTNDKKSLERIADENFLTEKKLTQMRKKFYETWRF